MGDGLEERVLAREESVKRLLAHSQLPGDFIQSHFAEPTLEEPRSGMVEDAFSDFKIWGHRDLFEVYNGNFIRIISFRISKTKPTQCGLQERYVIMETIIVLTVSNLQFLSPNVKNFFTLSTPLTLCPDATSQKMIIAPSNARLLHGGGEYPMQKNGTA